MRIVNLHQQFEKNHCILLLPQFILHKNKTMFLIGFLILILVLILSLLLIPIVLFIDTATNQYYMQLPGLATASVESHEEEFIRIKLKLFFLSFYFCPLKNNGPKKTKKTENKVVKKKGKSLGFAKGLRVLKSIRVKRLLVDIDTGDCILNAKLYPFFALLNYKIGKFNINFEGKNRFLLHLYSRPIYIIKSFFNF